MQQNENQALSQNDKPVIGCDQKVDQTTQGNKSNADGEQQQDNSGEKKDGDKNQGDKENEDKESQNKNGNQLQQQENEIPGQQGSENTQMDNGTTNREVPSPPVPQEPPIEQDKYHPDNFEKYSPGISHKAFGLEINPDFLKQILDKNFYFNNGIIVYYLMLFRQFIDPKAFVFSSAFFKQVIPSLTNLKPLPTAQQQLLRPQNLQNIAQDSTKVNAGVAPTGINAVTEKDPIKWNLITTQLDNLAAHSSLKSQREQLKELASCFFFPIEISEKHWISACIDLKKKRVRYFDSRGDKSANALIHRALFVAAIRDLRINESVFQIEVYNESDQLEDEQDSGVYVLLALLKVLDVIKDEVWPKDFRKVLYRIAMMHADLKEEAFKEISLKEVIQKYK